MQRKNGRADKEPAIRTPSDRSKSTQPPPSQPSTSCTCSPTSPSSPPVSQPTPFPRNKLTPKTNTPRPSPQRRTPKLQTHHRRPLLQARIRRQRRRARPQLPHRPGVLRQHDRSHHRPVPADQRSRPPRRAALDRILGFDAALRHSPGPVRRDLGPDGVDDRCGAGWGCVHIR
jgi:hypothetical protein